MTTEHKVLRIVQPEFVAILQHAAWHRACVAELLEAFSAGDIDRAMWTLQLMVQHPEARLDEQLVRGVCERLWPDVFETTAEAHAVAVQASVKAEVQKLLAAAAAGLPEPANDTPKQRLLYAVSPPAEDLPS